MNLVLLIALNMLGIIKNSILKDKNETLGMHLLNQSKVVVPRGDFIDLSVKADMDIFEKGITQINPFPNKEAVFIVEVQIEEFKEPPVLILSSTYHSKTEFHPLNQGTGLSNGAYFFNIVARSGEWINFKFKSAGIVKKFTVQEYYLP